MYNYLDNDTLMDMLAKKDAEITSLKARIKELDDALSDSQAHLAWAEQDSRALSELRQAARELITALRTEEKENELLDADYYTIPVIDARTKLETLLEKP